MQEIKEQDNTISEKEKRIYDLKKKNQELEKFKFVLDHKIKELKKQIEPKEEEIADMKDQIKARPTPSTILKRAIHGPHHTLEGFRHPQRGGMGGSSIVLQDHVGIPTLHRFKHLPCSCGEPARELYSRVQ